ncbi:ABC transporter ATP-binding protein [Caldisericum exile]|uniref:ABC transporter ATP-binding protein n=1 Tax=Caldisericum exile (strain DSM 21853 / NBRC 104410 / AZM16c01) TaxID=511051 RepID=A0A7U6GDI1_CALEA|nr:ATP-binding cassette domain-containing protein [Caldisericum exile]BAL80356.1 putative ABC transporter ATP-binding protein [Caldisericum exile AZM16c01]
MDKAIVVENLKRVYKKGKDSFFALDGISFEVHYGEIFGFLGPNGAGKTTTIKILSTLLYPTSGKAFVGGFDVEKEVQKIREIINLVSGGESAGYGILTVKESLWMFSQFYGIPTNEASKRIEHYLKLVGMWDSKDTLLNRLSTGMMQKVNLVRGLITDPKILFLDEPTIGLDVEAARTIRSIVSEWVKEKPTRTVLLTTHYMAEADELCDRIAIINKGRIVALDTPENLKKAISDEIFFEIETSIVPKETSQILTNDLKEFGINCLIKDHIERGVSTLSVILKEEKDIAKVIQKIVEVNKEILSLRKIEPTLEDVFIKLVGKRLEDEETN